jgi:hypothetical protein
MPSTQINLDKISQPRMHLMTVVAIVSLTLGGLFVGHAANAESHADCVIEPTRLFDKNGVSRGLFNVEVCKWSEPVDTQPEEKAATESAMPEPAATPTFTVNFMRGKKYYNTEEGYTCKMNSPSRQEIGTWKSRIEVMRNFVMLWGNKCNDAPLLTNLKIEEFEFSEDGLSLTYNGEKFEYLENPPKFIE